MIEDEKHENSHKMGEKCHKPRYLEHDLTVIIICQRGAPTFLTYNPFICLFHVIIWLIVKFIYYIYNWTVNFSTTVWHNKTALA